MLLHNFRDVSQSHLHSLAFLALLALLLLRCNSFFIFVKSTFQTPPRATRALVPRSARRVLDVGCGAGASALDWLRASGGDSGRDCASSGVCGHEGEAEAKEAPVADGVEVHPLAAWVAGHRLAAHGGRVFQGSLSDVLPFIPDYSYDAIVVADVLEHLVEPDVALRSLRSKLRFGGQAGDGQASGGVDSGGVVVVSVPNLAYWPESLSKLLDGTWQYEDFGVLDRTHLRWFTRASFTALAELAGFVVIGSWDVGFDFHSEADAGTLRGTPAGDAYHSLPPTHRVDLDVRQFVFLLAPSPPLLAPPLAGFPFASNSSASAGEAGAHNVAPLDAGANAAAGSSAVHSFVQDASAAPSVTSGNDSPNRASSTGPDAPQGATVAIAIITASPVQDERLAQVEAAWAGWDWSDLRHFFVIAISDAEHPSAASTLPESNSGHPSAPLSSGVDAREGSGSRRKVPVVTVPCSANKRGLLCKTWWAFRTLGARAPSSARWFLRVMDDTLVFPRPLAAALGDLDASLPWYVGDLGILRGVAPLTGTMDMRSVLGDGGCSTEGVGSEEEDADADDDDEEPPGDDNGDVPVAFGGCGWALSKPALDRALAHERLWWAITEGSNSSLGDASDACGEVGCGGKGGYDGGKASNSEDNIEGKSEVGSKKLGWSPATPTLRLDSVIADDVLWGLFMASIEVHAFQLPGWSQAPMDFAAGVPWCPASVEAAPLEAWSSRQDRALGAEKCWAVQSDYSAARGASAAARRRSWGWDPTCRAVHCRVHDVGTVSRGGAGGAAPVTTRRAIATGSCRTRPVAPLVAHMGDELGAESGPWRTQMVKAGRYLDGLHRAAEAADAAASSPSQGPQHGLGSSGLGLRAYFEGSPLWYWRLCAETGESAGARRGDGNGNYDNDDGSTTVKSTSRGGRNPDVALLAKPSAAEWRDAARRTLRQSLELNGAEDEMVVTLCGPPWRGGAGGQAGQDERQAAADAHPSGPSRDPVRAMCEQHGLSDDGDSRYGDGDSAGGDHRGRGLCAALRRLAEKLRDHLRFHTPKTVLFLGMKRAPAGAQPSDILSSAGGDGNGRNDEAPADAQPELVHAEVSLEVGDDPWAAAAAFGAAHEMSSEDVASLAFYLSEAQAPVFNYSEFCDSLG